MGDKEEHSEEQNQKLGKASYMLREHFNYQKKDLYNEFISGDKPSLRNLFKKKLTREDKLRIAREFTFGVGLLYRIIKLKVNYITKGFRIHHKDPEVKKIFDELNRELNIDNYIKNAAFEHEVAGEWFPFISWDNEKINKLTILKPEQVKVKSIFGEDFIYLKPSLEIRKLLNDPDEEVKKRVRQVIPNNYYKEWSNGEEVLLSKDEVFRYTNLKPYYEGYGHCPIEPVFDDLALLSMYKESDYSVAYKIKKAILHVTVGDSEIFDGNPVPDEILDQAEQMFEGSQESTELITQWFMDMDYKFPPKEVYAPEKYEPVIRNILQWSGASIFLDGDGSYSDAEIKVDGFYEDIKSARSVIKKSILDIYEKIAEIKGLKTYGDKLKFPDVKFSSIGLQSKEDLIDSVKFLYKHGLLTPETTLDTFNFDYDEEISIKEEGGKQEEYLKYITVPFEPSQDVNMRSFLRKEMEQEQQENDEVNTNEEEVNNEQSKGGEK